MGKDKNAQTKQRIETSSPLYGMFLDIANQKGADLRNLKWQASPTFGDFTHSQGQVWGTYCSLGQPEGMQFGFYACTRIEEESAFQKLKASMEQGMHPFARSLDKFLDMLKHEEYVILNEGDYHGGTSNDYTFDVIAQVGLIRKANESECRAVVFKKNQFKRPPEFEGLDFGMEEETPQKIAYSLEGEQNFVVLKPFLERMVEVYTGLRTEEQVS